MFLLLHSLRKLRINEMHIRNFLISRQYNVSNYVSFSLKMIQKFESMIGLGYRILTISSKKIEQESKYFNFDPKYDIFLKYNMFTFTPYVIGNETGYLQQLMQNKFYFKVCILQLQKFRKINRTIYRKWLFCSTSCTFYKKKHGFCTDISESKF